MQWMQSDGDYIPADMKSSALIPSTYAPLLADLKARVRAAQVGAAEFPETKGFSRSNMR